MKQNTKSKKTKSIIVILYGVMLSVLIAIFGILMVNNSYQKELAYECLIDKTELYNELLIRETQNISRDIRMIRLNHLELMREFPKEASAKDGEYYDLWNELKEINHTEEKRYDSQYSFFEYGYDADVLLIKNTLYFTDSRCPEYLEEMVEKLRANCLEDKKSVVWDYVRDGETDYLFGSVQAENQVVGCLVKMNDLLGDFQIENMGYEGFLVFEKDGAFYSSTETMQRTEIQNLLPKLNDSISERTKDHAWYTYDLSGIGNIKIITLLSNGVLERVNVFQWILSISFAVIVGIVIYMIVYLYKGILNPMRQFVTQLKNPEMDVYLNEKDGMGSMELIYASDTFKKMYRELQSLRIDLYEKELSEKTVMLEYAQEQMKPHFFLNCMSVVQSMAELHHEKEIVDILERLSKYMRYVLKDSFEVRSIEDELEHLNEYMKIQALCKPGLFTYEAVVDEELKQCKILPLILQTIVENSVKHGLKPDRCIEISIYITSMEIDQKKYLYIVISDTGNGFPKEILNKIKQEEPIVYDGCEHLGIKNTMKRVKMRYGEKASVTLSNMKENYGAVVEIILPYEA